MKQTFYSFRQTQFSRPLSQTSAYDDVMATLSVSTTSSCDSEATVEEVVDDVDANSKAVVVSFNTRGGSSALTSNNYLE